jgi:2'-5' RNA ligase
MDKPIRAFIAVPVPESVKEQIGLFEGDLIKTRADVKWVRPESMHVTLKFLGDVEERDTAEVVRRIEEAVGATKPFAVRIAKTGVFPNEKRPNVLWVGATEGADRLAELAGLVDSALLPMVRDRRGRSPAARPDVRFGRFHGGRRSCHAKRTASLRRTVHAHCHHPFKRIKAWKKKTAIK